MAVLVLQTAAAGAGIVAADFLIDPDGSVGLLFPVSGELAAGRLHAGHVRPAGSCRLPEVGPLPALVLSGIAKGYERPEEETENVLVQPDTLVRT